MTNLETAVASITPLTYFWIFRKGSRMGWIEWAAIAAGVVAAFTLS